LLKGSKLDFTFRILYWTDSQQGGTLGVIYAAADDGRYKKALIIGRRFQPSAIVVDPGLG